MASPLRTLAARLPRHRAFSTSAKHCAQKPFGSGPAPPRLPKEDQELFEKLQKQSTGAFSTPKEDVVEAPSERPNIRMRINQSPDSTPQSGRLQINQSPDSASSRPQINQSPHDSGSEDGGVEIHFENGKDIKKGEEFHPNMRRGAKPEFEGDVNPKTGEVGGPKNEPLRWGSGEGRGDWSYNGRVTDF